MERTFEERGELNHYGRLGMKWGKHIYGKDDPIKTGKKINEMSEEELDKYTKRYRAETNYIKARYDLENAYLNRTIKKKLARDVVVGSFVAVGKKVLQNYMYRKVGSFIK